MNLFRTLREFFTQGSTAPHEHGPTKDASFEDELLIPASAQDAHENLHDALNHTEFMRG